MALAPRSFALDFNRKKVYANASRETSYAFAPFYNGDTESLVVYIVEADPTGGQGALTTVTPTGLSLKVAIGPRDASETVYTSATLTVSGQTFVGDLPLNVAAIDNLFTSSAADQTHYIEFELNDGGALHTVRFQVTLSHHIIANSLTDTPAPDTAIGRQEADALYVKKANTDSSATWQMIVNDSDGSGRLYVLKVVGGNLRLDPIGS